jgi:hypothetical protein
MFRCRRLLRAILMLGFALFLFDTTSPEAVAQKRRTPPRPARIGRVHHFVVQARDPRWRAVTVAPNRQAALAIKVNLVRRGFQVRLKPQSGGRVAVLARMMHWHAVGVYTTRPLANHFALILRQRGMQARVITAK